MEVSYTIEKTLAEISDNGVNCKRLTLTSWNGYPAKLDLRTWRRDGDQMKPGKGLTLSDEEARALAEALQRHIQGQ